MCVRCFRDEPALAAFIVQPAATPACSLAAGGLGSLARPREAYVARPLRAAPPAPAAAALAALRLLLLLLLLRAEGCPSSPSGTACCTAALRAWWRSSLSCRRWSSALA